MRTLLANYEEDWPGEFTVIPETAFTLLTEAIGSAPDSAEVLPDSKTMRRYWPGPLDWLGHPSRHTRQLINPG